MEDTMKNSHIGSKFDDFLEQDSILNEVSDLAMKKAQQNNFKDDNVALLVSKLENIAKLQSKSFKFLVIILSAIIVNSIGVVAVLIKSFL